MRACALCGHHTWLTAGIRACGACDLMGSWPRITGTTVATSRVYDWAEDDGYDL